MKKGPENKTDNVIMQPYKSMAHLYLGYHKQVWLANLSEDALRWEDSEVGEECVCRGAE